jgi:hypothetical protein
MPYTELVEDRLRFLEIDKEVLEELKRARQYIEPEIDNMLAGFYALILQDVALHALFKDADSVKHAREAQKKHWLKNVLSGKYGSAYFSRADKIGRTHARVGLAPQAYIGGYSKMLTQFIDRISEQAIKEGRDPRTTIQAVCRAVLLDIDLVIHCYLEAKNEVMRQVLRRATDFSNDMSEMVRNLADTGDKIQDSSASLLRNDTDPAEQSRALKELLSHIESLGRQSTQIRKRADDLQFVDRLHIENAPSTFDRLRAMFTRK